MSEPIKSFVLMGLKHCGKSTQGKIISERLNLPFVDTDVLIEQEKGMTAREIYAKEGVVSFTLAEQKACEDIARDYAGKSVIVAAGGGICDNPPGLTALREVGPFVFINLDINYCISRVEKRISQNEFGTWINAPAYVLVHEPKSMVEIHQILFDKFQNRIEQYRRIADIIIPISAATIEVNTEEIMKALF